MITTLLLAALIANLMLPMAASAAQDDNKVVRVGWFDSSFCYYDQFGRRCGIDYEYHQKISAYTGWTYEYVEDSWPNLLQKLKDGEIDLLSDVSYKPEREQYMYFSDLAMGTEAYYIYIDADNREITSENLSSFNGKKIGVNKDSIQETFLKDWTKKNEVSPKIVPLTCSEDESMELLIKGEIDGLATVFTFDFTKDVITGLEGFAARLAAEGESPAAWFDARRNQWADKILVVTDISQGVVPIDKTVREAREANGRLMIYLAAEAEQVHRVFCGIGKRIK